jgi:acyl carrier protein
MDPREVAEFMADALGVTPQSALDHDIVEVDTLVVVALQDNFSSKALQRTFKPLEGNQVLCIASKEASRKVEASIASLPEARGCSIDVAVCDDRAFANFLDSIFTFADVVILDLPTAERAEAPETHAPGALDSDAIATAVAQSVASVLSIDNLDHAASLWELGLTSALAVQLSTAFEASLGVEVPTTVLFDYTSVRDISDAISGQTVAVALHDSGPSATPKSHPVTPQGDLAEVTSRELSESIEQMVLEVLGISEVGEEESLWDAGLSSATAVQLSSKLESLVTSSVPPTIAFDFPTVLLLSQHLSRISAPAVQKRAVRLEAPVEDTKEPAAETLVVHSTSVNIPSDSASASGIGLWAIADRIGLVPHSRWDESEVSQSVGGGLRFGGFFRDVESFTPQIFGMSAGESAATDPQQRLVVLNSAQNFSASGRLGSGRNTGCFVGASQFDYFTICLSTAPRFLHFMGWGTLTAALQAG